MKTSLVYRYVIFCWAIFLLTFLESCKKNQYLRGYYSWSEFSDSCQWKVKINEKYRPDSTYLDSLKRLNVPMDLKLFLGTWCSDSRRWVPRFMAIQSYLPIQNIQIISVDTTKKDSLKWYQTYQVDSIPMFVFLESGTQNEIGRLKVKPYKRKLEKTLYLNLKEKGIR
ncbi:MAG: hypothetical protein KatS3mg035_0637 [Bacteroidia bacterium]|nr:MAG: hypothetical protein KatS3mg035_0637 [Bacteroidia bacterium]